MARLSAVVIVASGVVSLQAIAQCDSELKAAETVFYVEHDLDRAATLFEEISDDYSCASKRKDALLWLARMHDLMKRAEDAFASLERLLEEEPPVVELDPVSETPQLMRLYWKARVKKNERLGLPPYQVERRDPGLQTIAIVDFENHSIDDREKLEPLRWGLSYFVEKTLAKRTPLKVVERARLRWLLRELYLQSDSSIVDQTMAVRAGKLLGATAVFFGTFMKLGGEVIATGRVVKVETGEVLLAVDVAGKTDDLIKLTSDLSERVAAELGVVLETERPEAQTESPLSEEALIAYSTGLKLETEGDQAEALYHYQQAYDKGYEPAKLKIERLEPHLATAEE